MDHVSADPEGFGPGGDGPGVETGPDDPTLDRLRSMWELLDPAPAGLAERVGFALEVEALTSAEDLDLELMRLVQEESSSLGSRGDEVRTITFGSESMTVMLALTDVDGGYRVDGWVAPGGRRRIEVRTAGGPRDIEADSTGRFTVPLVPPGHFQLVLDGGTLDGADAGDPTARTAATRRAVVTPALTL